MSGYPVPAGEARIELRCRNSRFLGTVDRAETVTAARALVERARQGHPDASHHVYAFAVGYGATVVHGMSDDGEPAGTAGRPVLAVVQGSGLGDVVVVVTRWFGGTKLGTGGLVRAYTETAQAVLAAVARQQKVHAVWFCLDLEYGQHPACRKALVERGATIIGEEFGASVALVGWIGDEGWDGLRQALLDASAGRAVPRIIEPPASESRSA
ncbi:MAG: YigZ family protein [Candidatus Latescibacterota bacterium]|jgi:uncharacterized YigZ family protein